MCPIRPAVVYEEKGKERERRRKRNIYSREFKGQAVQLLNTSGKPGNQIEAELGIGTGIIYRWRRQLQEDGVRAFPGNGNERDKELSAILITSLPP